MQDFRRKRFWPVLLLLLFPAGLPCVAGEEPAPGTVSPVAAGTLATWTRLEYRASGVAGSVTTSLELNESSVGEMQARSHASFENHPVENPPHRIMQLFIHGRAQSLFGDSSTEGRIWFDPRNGAVLQNDRLRHGKSPSRKLYRFAENGAFRTRLDPGNSTEARGPSGDWSRLKESFYPYDPDGAGCGVVSDPALLLYLAAGPEVRDSRKAVSFCVFRDGSLYRVWLDRAGDVSMGLDYTLHRGDSSEEISGMHDTLKLALRVEPLSPGADPGDFELLELRGAIAIHIDRVTGVPVQITGERDLLGRVDIGLLAAVIRD